MSEMVKLEVHLVSSMNYSTSTYRANKLKVRWTDAVIQHKPMFFSTGVAAIVALLSNFGVRMVYDEEKDEVFFVYEVPVEIVRLLAVVDKKYSAAKPINSEMCARILSNPTVENFKDQLGIGELIEE